MLFNPDWKKPETKTDVFSLESLIAWLETMPANLTYDWHDCAGACLIGIYLNNCGFDWDSRHYQKFGNYNIRTSVAGERPYTFGAALTRARAALIGNERT